MSEHELRNIRDEADRFAQASHLAVLSDGDPDEIRLWLTWATFDPMTNGIATVGYIVTDSRSSECRITYRGESTAPRSGRCTRLASKWRTRVIGDLVRLSAFADTDIDCDMVDGDWVVIDAVSVGKRFVLWVNNPELCSLLLGAEADAGPGGSGRKIVAEMLEKMAPHR
jgi:hypothetical protein